MAQREDKLGVARPLNCFSWIFGAAYDPLNSESAKIASDPYRSRESFVIVKTTRRTTLGQFNPQFHLSCPASKSGLARVFRRDHGRKLRGQRHWELESPRPSKSAARWVTIRCGH